MPRPSRYVLSSLALVSTIAAAQEIAVLRDLEAQGRATLSKDEQGQLLPSARMSRSSSGADYYATKSDKTRTEKVYKLVISK